MTSPADPRPPAVAGIPASRFSGRVALVTGSTSGIGAAVARRLHAEGAAVVVTGRHSDRGAAVVAGLGSGAHFVGADLAAEDACDALVAQTVERFGRLDVVVNNAVLSTGPAEAPVAQLDTARWEAALRVNVTAAMWVTRAALPHLCETGHGAIVNVSSRAAERAPRNLPAYVASKGALNALTRSVAVDYAPYGVRCNTISPGYVLHEHRDRDLTEQRRAELQRMHLTRLATAPDVAAAVCFLASDDAACITGINLPVDGGSSTAARAASLG